MSLSLSTLREANQLRERKYKNAQGKSHDCKDWTLNDWYTATGGEFGELGNVLKKVRRKDFTLDKARNKIAKELADTLCYLDLLAFHAGIDLDEAVRKKWNIISRRIGYNGRINTKGEIIFVDFKKRKRK